MVNYYKLINGTTFVGIATSHDFREYQSKHNILLGCAEESGQYIQYEDNLYRDYWMKPITTDNLQYINVSVIEIDENEYQTLYQAIESGQEIPIEDDNTIVEDDVYIDPNEELTIEYVMNAKIREMSNICNTVITNGFDIVLSDEELHHFSLTTQDQLNLITLSTMITSGETAIPYHADGELCKFYTVADIQLIVNAATAFKTYHVSYFNSLKSYVEALDDIKSISAIEYGIDIPAEYQSNVLKVLLRQMAAENE